MSSALGGCPSWSRWADVDDSDDDQGAVEAFTRFTRSRSKVRLLTEGASLKHESIVSINKEAKRMPGLIDGP
jgi:hypothetical protein